MTETGFEPAPRERLRPEHNAFDRSAILPLKSEDN